MSVYPGVYEGMSRSDGRGYPVRAPMPSVWPSLTRMAIFAIAAVSALTLAVSASVIFALSAWLFVGLVEANRRRYGQTIKVRAQLREWNFWAVMEHQIDTPLPDPSDELAEIEADLEKAYRRDIGLRHVDAHAAIAATSSTMYQDICEQCMGTSTVPL